MKLSNYRLFLFILFIGVVFILTGCDGGGGGSSDTSDRLSLETGEAVILGSASVGVAGSLLYVNNPEDQLHGLEINVPSGAYQNLTEFTVSSTPIIGHSGNENIDPVTPLISIENGGGYADEIITMKIPVTVEDGYHYMAFYYDETTGVVEGLPEISHDPDSLTIATRHFSKIWVNRMVIAKAFVFGSFGSGYQVKQDNWQFDNYGTYLSPGGICSGMSIASLYYFHKKRTDLGDPQLFSRYDNGTAKFGLDDDLAIKLCSTAQYYEGNFQGLTYDYWYNMGRKKNDIWTYFMFCHAMLLSEEPQYVSIFPSDGSAGHALVVYKKSGNGLYVADPNLPTDEEVKIEFEWDDKENFKTGHFKPFESQWNSGTGKIDFTEIFYIGKTAVVNWSDLDELWVQLNKKTVGTDFPDYSLKIIEKNASGTEKESLLTDGYQASNNTVQIKVVTYDFDPRVNVFYENTPGLLDNNSETIEVRLEPGKNRLGFFIEAEMYSDVTRQKEWAWTDFKYFNITLDETAPPIDDCVVGEWTVYNDEGCKGSYEQHPRPWIIKDDGSSKYDNLIGRWSLADSQLTINHPVDPRLVWTATVKNGCNLLEGEKFYNGESYGCWRATRIK